MHPTGVSLNLQEILDRLAGAGSAGSTDIGHQAFHDLARELHFWCSSRVQIGNEFPGFAARLNVDLKPAGFWESLRPNGTTRAEIVAAGMRLASAPPDALTKGYDPEASERSRLQPLMIEIGGDLLHAARSVTVSKS